EGRRPPGHAVAGRQLRIDVRLPAARRLPALRAAAGAGARAPDLARQEAQAGAEIEPYRRGAPRRPARHPPPGAIYHRDGLGREGREWAGGGERLEPGLRVAPWERLYGLSAEGLQRMRLNTAAAPFERDLPGTASTTSAALATVGQPGERGNWPAAYAACGR